MSRCYQGRLLGGGAVSPSRLQGISQAFHLYELRSGNPKTQARRSQELRDSGRMDLTSLKVPEASVL